MTTAILLLACLLLAGAVVALGAALRRLGSRLAELERGLVTGASPPSSTSESESVSVPSSASQSVGVPSSASESVSEPSPTDGPSEFVITRLGTEPEEEPAPTLETRLFADVVLRETVVKAASWAYGVRRGLSPANRNRIWFEMRREVKRARKQRKVEEREAVREWRARRRAAVQEESAA